MTRSAGQPLAGRAVVVDPRATDVALAMARYGATVVIAGGDAKTAGTLARQVEAVGGRAAVFTGDLTRESDRTALAELLSELFR
jgi:NAD(P)-dependent dehydrogenase (short-subunit alcohol dehydrogenase family)